MRFQYDDGGRAAAGFKGETGDCVVRAVALASGQPYAVVYNALSAGCCGERRPKRGRVKSSARNGVRTRRKWFKDYMVSLGFVWTPTMHIGSGCKVHLTDGELPSGRLVVSVSGHYTAVLDGVIHDTYDPQREPETFYDGKGGSFVIGGRCVYGYWCSRAA